MSFATSKVIAPIFFDLFLQQCAIVRNRYFYDMCISVFGDEEELSLAQNVGFFYNILFSVDEMILIIHRKIGYHR